MDLAFHAMATVLLLRIGLSDWRRRRIANRDVAAVALVAALGAACSPPPAIAVAGSCAVALALTLPGFLMGRVGGGDLKLLCALAPLFSGLELLTFFVSGVAVVGAALLVCAPRRAGHGGVAWAAPSLPLGSAMACGAAIWLASGLAAHV